MPIIPPTLAVTDCGGVLDGGTLIIFLRDTAGSEHTLKVPQHHIAGNFRPGEPPGALIFDGEVLAVRGSAEQELVTALRAATYMYAEHSYADHSDLAEAARLHLQEWLRATGEDVSTLLRHAVADILEFVGSEAYVDVARRFGRVP